MCYCTHSKLGTTTGKAPMNWTFRFEKKYTQKI